MIDYNYITSLAFAFRAPRILILDGKVQIPPLEGPRSPVKVRAHNNRRLTGKQRKQGKVKVKHSNNHCDVKLLQYKS